MRSFIQNHLGLTWLAKCLFCGGLLLCLACEDEGLRVSFGDTAFFPTILDYGNEIQISANMEVDWVLSSPNSGTIRNGWFIAGDTSGVFVLEAISQDNPNTRKEIRIRISHRAQDLNPLLDGGHIIYLRHAIARTGGDLFDAGPAGWHWSCDPDTARQLSPAGYMQAQQLGEAFRNLEIPLEDTVYVSEYCRCIQTVEEMQLGLPFLTHPDLTFYVYDEATRQTKIQAMINSFSPTDKNVLLVAHSFGPGNTYQQPEQGYAVIFSPGATEPEFRTVIRDDEFIQLR